MVHAKKINLKYNIFVWIILSQVLQWIRLKLFLTDTNEHVQSDHMQV